MSTTPRTDAARGFHDMDTAVSDEDMAQLETELIYLREENKLLKAAIRSEHLWKEFITLMDITEESDSGYAFNPNKISSCRAMDGKRLNEILNEARQIVF